MGQGFIQGQKGGGKFYTAADCSYNTSTWVLTLPDGVTYGDIAYLSIMGKNSSGYIILFTKQTTGEALLRSLSTNYFLATYLPQPSAGDTTIDLNGGSSSARISRMYDIFIALK